MTIKLFNIIFGLRGKEKSRFKLVNLKHVLQLVESLLTQLIVLPELIALLLGIQLPNSFLEFHMRK